MTTHPSRFSVFFAFTLAALLGPGQVAAAPLSEGETNQVRNVIVAQFAAFAEDDAEGAFAAATPGVREAMGNPVRFLAMVRGAYPMVYRPNSASFHKPEIQEGNVLQLVEITDGDAKSWLAIYALELQPDNTWRISGCVVSENKWKAI